MRKLVLFLCGIFAFVTLSATPILDNNDNLQKVKLEKKKDKDQVNGSPRSLNYLEAYYDANANAVEVHHDCLGLCEMYILDSFGNVFDSTV